MPCLVSLTREETPKSHLYLGNLGNHISMTIRPTDLRKEAQQLIRQNKMPSLDRLLQAVAEARAKYIPLIRQARSDTNDDR